MIAKRIRGWVDKARRRRDEYGLSLKCFQSGIIDRNPDSIKNANKDLTVANLKEFMVHRDIQLVKAVKHDNRYFAETG